MILDMWMLLELFESKVLVEIWNANNIHMGPPCVCMRHHGYPRGGIGPRREPLYTSHLCPRGQTSSPRPLNSNISGGWVLVCAFLYRLLASCF